MSYIIITSTNFPYGGAGANYIRLFAKGFRWKMDVMLIYGDNREFYNGQQRFLLYHFHIADPIRFENKFRMTLDNMGWTGPRYDDYTSVAYWYQTLPSAPLMPLPTDAEMCMR